MKKGYNISIDHEVMGLFQKNCPSGKKYSHLIEEMLVAYNAGGLLFTNEIDDRLQMVKDSVASFKELGEQLDDLLNPVDNHLGELDNEEWG